MRRLSPLVILPLVLAACDPVSQVYLQNDLDEPVVAWNAEDPIDRPNSMFERVVRVEPGQVRTIFEEIAYDDDLLFRVATASGGTKGCIKVVLPGEVKSYEIPVRASEAGPCPTSVRVLNDTENFVNVKKAGLPTRERGTVLWPNDARETRALHDYERKVVFRVRHRNGAEIGCIRVTVEPQQVGTIIDVRVSDAGPCTR